MKKKSCRVHSNSFFSSSSAKPAAGGRGCATEGSKSPQRGGWPTKSAWFYPQPNLPLGEGLVDSLREGSAPVFRQSFLTFPQPFRSPYTTAADSAFLCRCGMAFPPYPCYGLPGRHCLLDPFPQRHQFQRFSAVAELLFRRILAMGFLDGIASPVPFHNGTNSCISLPLWKEQTCSPSEGELKTWENCTPSEGGKWRNGRETPL